MFRLDISFRMLIVMRRILCNIIVLYIFLYSYYILLKTFEGWKDANYNEKNSVTLEMIEDMRMQFVDLFNIDFVDKLIGADTSSLRF